MAAICTGTSPVAGNLEHGKVAAVMLAEDLGQNIPGHP